mmetsp:Transcript_44703/g.133540  ORF Transcript_44703/g.133540 Transcript_44703/m.133540 type:complete len:223 (-) Transcript_44703:452-1120(-)
MRSAPVLQAAMLESSSWVDASDRPTCRFQTMQSSRVISSGLAVSRGSSSNAASESRRVDSGISMRSSSMATNSAMSLRSGTRWTPRRSLMCSRQLRETVIPAMPSSRMHAVTASAPPTMSSRMSAPVLSDSVIESSKSSPTLKPHGPDFSRRDVTTPVPGRTSPSWSWRTAFKSIAPASARRSTRTARGTLNVDAMGKRPWPLTLVRRAGSSTRTTEIPTRA